MIRGVNNGPSESSPRVHRQKDNTSLDYLFVTMDVNGDGKLTKEEFRNGILGIGHWDMTEIEVSRMFHSIDTEERGYITHSEFEKAAHRWRWLRSVANVVCACKKNQFVVSVDYNYTKPTCENYQGPSGQCLVSRAPDYLFVL
jgi:hypothetical protein